MEGRRGQPLVGRILKMRDSPVDQNPYLVLAVICSAMFLDLSNLSAITIALPTIQREWSTASGDLPWAVSSYSITFGGFLLLGGRGGDLFGHRNVLLFGMAFFAIFTMVCGLAPNFVGLVLARSFQGIGAAFTIPCAQAHISMCFPEPSKKARALGIWGAAGSIGFIVGIILGGVLTAFLGWRWIFWISLILSGVIIPLAFFILPKSDGSTQNDNTLSQEHGEHEQVGLEEGNIFRIINKVMVRFDPIGILLSITGILLLTYALTSANTVGWGTVRIIVPLIISIILLAGFVMYERQHPNGIIPPHIFKSVSFNVTLLLAINTYAVRQACTYFLTIQLQSFGNSAIQTSVLFIPLGISGLIFNSLSGRLVPILGARAMFILGWACAIPGVLLFSFIQQDSSYWRYTFPGMVLYIAGIGAVYLTANFIVVSSVSKANQGVAAGIFNVALQVGGSVLGLAVVTAIAQGIQQKYAHSSSESGAFSHTGYKSVYYSCSILCFIGLVLSVFAIEIPENMQGSLWQSYRKRGDMSVELN